jgi:hypothetical protein
MKEMRAKDTPGHLVGCDMIHMRYGSESMYSMQCLRIFVVISKKNEIPETARQSSGYYRKKTKYAEK